MLAFKTHLGRCLSLGLIIALSGTDAVAASTEADQLRAELEALKIENAKQAERMCPRGAPALEAAAPPPATAALPRSLEPPGTPAPPMRSAVNQARVRVDEEQHDTECVSRAAHRCPSYAGGPEAAGIWHPR